jgi:uncharacterized damage-inducible protein DinB
MPPKKAQRKQSLEKQIAALVREDWKREVGSNYLSRITNSLELLSDEEIWWRANEASNSLGNLVLHLSGNMRQWIISGLGGAKDIRQRDLEFSERGPIPRGELVERLRKTIREASDVIDRLSPSDLTKNYVIQGFQVTGYEAASHVSAHVAYHAGQVVYVAKMKRAKDLGFTKLPALPAQETKTKKPRV